MREAGSTFELGRAYFAKSGLRKPTNDERFMNVLANLASREEKRAEFANWKAGWDAAKADSLAEAEVKEAPKKKAKKKTAKKKAKK